MASGTSASDAHGDDQRRHPAHGKLVHDDRGERIEQMRVIDDQQQVFHVIERVVRRGEQADRLKRARDLHDAGEGRQRHVPRRLSP